MLHGIGMVVIMDQQRERHTYPHNSRNPKRRAKGVVASDCSATSESKDHGDSGDKTQGANRFAAVGSPEPEGGAEQMASFKEITRTVFSSWTERRQQVMKESRERSQSKVEPQDT